MFMPDGLLYLRPPVYTLDPTPHVFCGLVGVHYLLDAQLSNCHLLTVFQSKETLDSADWHLEKVEKMTIAGAAIYQGQARRYGHITSFLTRPRGAINLT